MSWTEIDSRDMMPDAQSSIGTRIIQRRTPESAAVVASVKRAMEITPVLNRLTYADADADAIRAVSAS